MQGRPPASLTLGDFTVIGQNFQQSPLQCMTKFQEVSVSGTLKPGVWSQPEDQLLVVLVTEQYFKWAMIAAVLNMQFHRGLPVRTGKKCRERWRNHLDPSINRGRWTPEDDLRLVQAYLELGNQWSRISRLLGDRTESAVKNRINSLLTKVNQDLGVVHAGHVLESLLSQLTPGN